MTTPDTSVATGARPSSVRRWLPITTLALVAAGLAVATYLTITHYTSPAMLLCSANSVVDCEAVTTSPESQILGIPVAVLGVAFFLFMAVMTTPTAWRSPSSIVRWLRLGAAGVGVIFVAYLVSAELILIGRICLWCTAVHVITLALAGVILAGELGRGTVDRAAEPAVATAGMGRTP
jgi:uncharacterized membrane protein